MAGRVENIPIERIHLYEENPRHGKMTDPDKIIEYLLGDEQVYELAKSIAEHSTNPLELVGLVRLDDKDEKGEPTYEVWEGNRRICAIMLLNDPDRAPTKWKKKFQELSKDVELIETIEGREFDDHDELRFWMRNIHNGTQDGRGRKDWGPDEQHRDNPSKKNAIAFELLEHAQSHGQISAASRKGKLTTLQRFVEKPAFRELLGVDDTNPSKVKFKRSSDELSRITDTLVADMKKGDISSRKNDSDISDYVKELPTKAKVSPLPKPDGKSKSKTKESKGQEKPAPPTPSTKIKRDPDLAKALNEVGADKLISLYGSICSISAKSHPPLVAVGIWSLLESTSKLHGASENTAFNHYWTKGQSGRIAALGISVKQAGVIQTALERLAEGGNTTKHHAVSGTFDHRQLINDVECVTPVLTKALNSLKK